MVRNKKANFCQFSAKKGWKGPDCGTMDQDALQCLPDCTGHGTFDLDTQTCNCEPKWSGDDCSKGTYFAHITTHPYHLQNLPNALVASLVYK